MRLGVLGIPRRRRFPPVPILMLPGLFACSDLQSATYHSLEDAQQAGVIDRGSIPAGLPLDARDIRVKYDLDTNATILRLSSDSLQTVTQLNGLPIAFVGPDQVRAPGIDRTDWWPSDFGRNSLFRVIDPQLHGPSGGTAYLYGVVQGDTMYLWRPIP